MKTLVSPESLTSWLQISTCRKRSKIQVGFGFERKKTGGLMVGLLGGKSWQIGGFNGHLVGKGGLNVQYFLIN